MAKAELEQSVKGKSTERDSLSGVSRKKVFVATVQPRGQLLTYTVVYLRLNMDKESAGLVMAGHACHTEKSRCFWVANYPSDSIPTRWRKT